MLIAKEEYNDRYREFMLLLNSSTFDDIQRDKLMDRFDEADESEVDDLINVLLANQIDYFYAGSYRMKDIFNQLDRHEDD